MANIIAARFETQAEADRALDALRSAGFDGPNLTSFYLNPAGQHAEHPGGGDAHHDEGTKASGKTSAAGATVGGVAGLALGTVAAAAAEPGLTAVAALAAAGVGAYVGSLAGGLSGARSGDASQATMEEPVERAAGIIVAANVDAEGAEAKAVQALRAQGGAALEIERASGEWREGDWVDFDPRRTPRFIDADERDEGPRGPAGPRA